MEKVVYSNGNYSVYKVGKESLMELCEFVVTENYKHHGSNAEMPDLHREIKHIYDEETRYSNCSQIFFVRNTQGKLIGSIRVFKWDKQESLPIEKLFNIHPLECLGGAESCTYWHVGRFAIDSHAGIPTLTIFKLLMTLVVEPIVQNENSFMIAETDSKLVRVVNALGIQTIALGEPVRYLASDTVPLYSTRAGLLDFYNKYRGLKSAS